MGQIRWSGQKRYGYLALGVLLALALLRLAPKAPLSEVVPSSRSVTAQGGELLRLTLAADGQFRLWLPLAEIAPSFQTAILLYEDRHFYWHPGVNPWSLLRSGASSFTGGRRMGGSTITMQLARRVYRIDSRSVYGKLWQMATALWIECRYSKNDILEAYLNTAPFGGNIEGIGAASLIYLNKPAQQLSVAEAVNLAVIPQNPKKRLLDSSLGMVTPELIGARHRLALLWEHQYPDAAHLLTEDALRVAFRSRRNLPFRAPHLTDMLLRQDGRREVSASIDLKVQSVLERVIDDYLKSRSDVGLNNGAAILVDTSTMAVKAFVGSADYRNNAIDGQVNGILGKRSPGSTLKPFIYGMALDQGIIHSASILRDAPSSYGGFSPENFDGRYVGPVSADEALIRSRNVPAVYLAARLSRPNLYDFLKMAGVDKLLSESHYGLALVLGGGEVTPEELVGLYAMLANNGLWQGLNYTQAERMSQQQQVQLLSPAAARIVLEMLRQTPRSDTFSPARPAVAWKTGTSWGFRDAWTAGVFGRYALVVWVGHFNGASNPALVGIDAAAPLFMRIVDALRAEGLDPGEVASVQPADLDRIEVCAASGDLPNEACRVRRMAWFIAGKSPIHQSVLHRTVLIDQKTGKATCKRGANVSEEVVEYWSSEMLALSKESGLSMRTPPASNCTDDALLASAPQIVSPPRGVVHLLRLSMPLVLALRADGEQGALTWFVDDSLVGRTRQGESIEWRPTRAGRYYLRVVDNNGLADSRVLVVENAY